MGNKQERERCTCVFDINGDGLAMVLFQMLTLSYVPITVVVHKDVPPGLLSHFIFHLLNDEQRN